MPVEGGQGSRTKTSRPTFSNPGETPGSARGGFVEAVEAGTQSSGLKAGVVYKTCEIIAKDSISVEASTYVFKRARLAG